MPSVDALPKDNSTKVSEPRWGRQDTARQFLPAALEILETPASLAGRAIGATIIWFFVLAGFGRVDIIATASGKIVPTGRTKTFQRSRPDSYRRSTCRMATRSPPARS